MVMESEGVLSGSPLELLPVIGYIQSRFDSYNSMKWLDKTWSVTVLSSCIYVAFLYMGKKFMDNRKPFDLKRVLFLWNVSLAVFSILGAVSILPWLLSAVYHKGLPYTACKSPGVLNPHICIWGFCFVLSKILEFGDTVFLILRKRPIMFLHWYHHITVLMFSWYCLGSFSTGLGHWFCSVNFFVHSIMYSYYAVVSGGVRLPPNIAQMITILQIAQMAIGITISVTIYAYRERIEDCDYVPGVVWSGLLMYLSYFILFAQYFHNRYVRS